MMSEKEEYLGVMNADYARGRQEKKYLNYRYRVRAQVAADAFRHFHPFQDEVNVCEFGAADMLTLLQIRELVGARGDYLGIEYAEDLIESAPPLPADTRVIQGNVMDLPDEVEEEHWDLVSCLAVLEHLPDPQACVDEAMRILKPGGVFVATCPNPFWDDLAGKFGMVADEFHEMEVTGDVLVDLCQTAGFVSVSFRPFMWVFTGVLPYIGVELTPEMSLQVDHFIHQLHLMDFSFVNQAVIAQKPY